MGAAAAVAGIGAVAGIAGSAMQSSAVSGAADKSIAAQQQAAAMQRADLQPWASAGQPATTAASNLLGLGGQDAANAAMGNFQQSPGYQWQLGEGLRAVDAGAAAKGMLRSGATLKGEMAYGQGLANQDFTNYYNRLFDMSKLGETAAAGQGAGSLSSANQQSATNQALGQQQASIYGNLSSGLSNAANTYMNNSLYADRTAALAGGNTPPTTYVMPPGGYSGYYGPGGGTVNV